jgi:hypothetical protein
MKHDDANPPFRIEHLVYPEPDAKAPPRAGPKAARKRVERFVQITETQTYKLGGASVVVDVFLQLMLKGLNARCPTFVLRPDAFKDIGIDRHAQLYALRDLAKRGLISVTRRDGPKKPPTVTVIGMRKTKG